MGTEENESVGDWERVGGWKCSGHQRHQIPSKRTRRGERRHLGPSNGTVWALQTIDNERAASSWLDVR